MKNRIQIVNWRKHGADEAYCKTEVFGADDDRDVIDGINAEVFDADPVPVDFNPGDAEAAEDWDHVYYVNDDFTLSDGDIVEDAKGRKFRVNITEIPT